jgi:hypothetical protein
VTLFEERRQLKAFPWHHHNGLDVGTTLFRYISVGTLTQMRGDICGKVLIVPCSVGVSNGKKRKRRVARVIASAQSSRLTAPDLSTATVPPNRLLEGAEFDVKRQ